MKGWNFIFCQVFNSFRLLLNEIQGVQYSAFVLLKASEVSNYSSQQQFSSYLDFLSFLLFWKEIFLLQAWSLHPDWMTKKEFPYSDLISPILVSTDHAPAQKQDLGASI